MMRDSATTPGSAQHVIGWRVAHRVRVLHEHLPGVDRNQEVVGRDSLRRRREREELDARMILRGDTAPAHDLVILPARRVAGIDARRRRHAERQARNAAPGRPEGGNRTDENGCRRSGRDGPNHAKRRAMFRQRHKVSDPRKNVSQPLYAGAKANV